jgi:hypothetical protein
MALGDSGCGDGEKGSPYYRRTLGKSRESYTRHLGGEERTN